MTSEEGEVPDLQTCPQGVQAEVFLDHMNPQSTFNLLLSGKGLVISLNPQNKDLKVQCVGFRAI